MPEALIPVPSDCLGAELRIPLVLDVIPFTQMAVFDASTRTSSGVTWTPGASDALAKWLNSKSWTGQFQDWAVDSDGDLESIVWSSDGRSTLSFYLSGWRQSGSGFNATGLAFQVLDDLGGRR